MAEFYLPALTVFIHSTVLNHKSNQYLKWRISLRRILLKQKKDAKTFVWAYFGSLCDRAVGKVTDTMNVYCTECFNDEKINA